MADLTQTPANVAPGSLNLRTKPVTYGETIAQGMPLYKSTTDQKYYKASAGTLAASKAEAIAMSAGVADGPGVVAIPSTTDGVSLINIGATLTVGQIYVVSATAGAIAPYSDLVSTKFVTVLGVAISATLLDLRCLASGIAKP